MKTRKTGKYRGIVMAIALFIVFDAAVLGSNFYMAEQFARDTRLVNLAARQRTLSQTTVKALLQTDNALGSGNVIDEPLAEFKNSYALFDETLQAFLDGGEVTAADGSRSFLEPLVDPAVRAQLSAANEVWQPFREKIAPVVNFTGTIERDADFAVGDEEAVLEGAMYEAIVYSAEQNTSGRLLDHLNKVAIWVESQAATRAAQLRVLQLGGIGLALALFVVIVFHFVRNLRRSDEALVVAQRQKDDILETVNEGLFLLDRDLRFGSHYSASVEKIFRRENLGGEGFLDLLKDIVPEKTLETARDYVELFFGGRVNERLVDDLNPLDKVEVHFKDATGGYVTRYLGFHFKRVRVGEDISHLLVTVDDITEMVALKRLLEQSQDQSKTQLDMLLDVLHIEPTILQDFLAQADENVNAINAVLKRSGQDQQAYRGKLDDIFRRAHAVKGEAGALGLHAVAKVAHMLEERVDDLKGRESLTGADFLPLTMRLDELMSQLQSIRKLIEKLVKFRDGAAVSPAAPPPDAGDRRRADRTDARKLFEQLAARVAEENGKKVQLACSGFEPGNVPEHYRQAVKDISIQLIRNGVCHGIESPEERLAAQKAQEGRVFLSFHRKGANFELAYRDDGRGLEVERIREAALRKGFVSADHIEKMTDRQIMALIFRRGFSTSVKVDGNSGRGVGMDVVRHLVHEVGGRIKMSTSAGKFTAFTVALPAETEATQAA